jgi:hypothetical protein
MTDQPQAAAHPSVLDELMAGAEFGMTIANLLGAADAWARGVGRDEEPVLRSEATLDVLSNPAASRRERNMAKYALGLRTPESARLLNDLASFGLDDAQYQMILSHCAYALQRNLAADGTTQACPVCGQVAINPNWRPAARWFARGVLNVGRALAFLALVGILVALGVMLVRAFDGSPG